MKKLLSITLLFFVTLSFSQRWSAYGIKVAPENEETVLKIIDDYFTNNKVEGVTVNLYSIMFTAADLNFTHEVIFEGDKESMSKLYTPDFQDTAWQLFSSKISNFVDENVFSANGYRAFEFGELMPFQMVQTFTGDSENINKWRRMTRELNEKYDKKCAYPIHMDVTNKQSIDEAICMMYNPFEMGGMGMKIDILINNAAKDPKVKKGEGNLKPDSRFEGMTMDYWNEGIDAALNGTFLVTQAVTNKMLENKTKGVVLNISSDLGVIAPDQRLYRKEGVPEDQQNVKPITYSAAKWAIIGMTKYLGVYFAQKNIRVNALSPTGVYNNHPEEFVKKLSNIIPMGRMADINEYKGAIVFMCSDASSYMTGENVVIDGGKSVW